MKNRLGLALVITAALTLSGCDPLKELLFGEEFSVQLNASTTFAYSLQEIDFHAVVDGGSGTYQYTWYTDSSSFSSAKPDRYFSRYVTETTTYTIHVSVSDGDETATSKSITVTVSPYTGSNSRSLDIVNGTGSQMDYLYISPSNAVGWGGDVLGASSLANGSTCTLSSLPPNTYYVAFELNGDSAFYYIASESIDLNDSDASYTILKSAATSGAKAVPSARSLVRDPPEAK